MLDDFPSAALKKDSGVSFATFDDESAVDSFARQRYDQHRDYYLDHAVSEECFAFATSRSSFEQQDAPKRSRKEIKLSELSSEQVQLFTGAGGADSKEWNAWLELDAAVPLDEATIDRIRRETPHLVIPTRWVRTNKAESAQDAFQAKSRLVVQGSRTAV